MTGEYDAGYENCIDSMVRQMEDMQFRIDSLHRENAKLRELVADMYMRFHGVVIENWAYSSEDFRMYEQRMRELGVEVDG